MANEIRKRANFTLGLVSDNPLLVGATTLNSSQLATLPAVGATEHMVLIFDPEQTYGAPEVVYVTSHGAGATSATIVRGREGSTARQHGQGVRWIHAPTISDFVRAGTAADRPSGTGLPYQGQTQYDQDTDQLVYWNGTAWVPVGQAARAWTVIDEKTPNAATVDFTSIPATFRHLQIILTGRGNAAVTAANAFAQINADGGANYQYQYVQGNGATASASNASGGTNIACGSMPGTSAAASRAGTLELLFPDYRSTTFKKTILTRGGFVDLPGTGGWSAAFVHLWDSTAAINRVTISFNAIGTGWVNGTVATLLGIR